MLPTIKALLSEIIDYAGLFPPAQLPMRETVRRYAAILEGDHPWMLGRLIVPAARLHEFEEAAADLLPRQAAGEAWRLSAITSPASDLAALDAEIDALDAFNDAHSRAEEGLAIIDSIELKAESFAQIDAAVELIPSDYRAFIEIPIAGDPRGLITAIAGTDAAAKVRTGGAGPANFPAPADLARFIWLCALAEVPFKATAGLHHPFRHDSRTVAGAKEFGFFNVFIGAALARFERIDETELAALLADESPSNFTFDENCVGWRGREVSLDDIAASRADFAISYGSCSFDEPVADLRALGLLRAAE